MNVSARQFLEVFFDADEEVCFRVFSDRKSEDPEFKGKKFEEKACNLQSLIPALTEHNQKNRGIFFVVNYGGHEDKDITRITAQFVESDTLPVDEQMKRVMEFPLEPSIIVRTRKSLHVYYLVENGKVEDFRRIQTKLAQQFDGDKTCVNESRVLRVPGFYHCKQDPVLVECVKFNPEIKYTQEELEKHLPGLPETAAKKQPGGEAARSSQFGLEVVCDQCLFIRYCKDNGKGLKEHDWYAMITNLAVFKGGLERIHEYSSAYPGYSRAETDGKISQYYKSKTGPIKCATIAAKGFRCPKLPDGCGCSSPAGLSFKVPSVETIRQKILELPVNGDEMIDNEVANKFVEEWLYNLEPAVAIAAIDNSLKKHFTFRTVKMLKVNYEKIHKQFLKDGGADKNALDIPPWYGFTENGGLRFKSLVLAEYLKDNGKAFYAAETFHRFENGVYKEICDDEAAGIIQSLMLKDVCTANHIRDALYQWRVAVRKPLNEINCNPFLINLKNGMFDVLAWKFKGHSEKYYSTVQLNVKYIPEAKCEKFIAFLHEVLEPRLIPLVQEILGYLLIPATNAQKSFVLYGPPRTGKSTMLWVIESLLLGPENVSNIPWQDLGERFKTAELFGKMANIFADLPNKSIEDSGMFKVITGEDYLSAERKNKNPFKFKPFARLVFSCNEIPRNYADKTDALYRRLVIIPFMKQVSEEKADTTLKDKLSAEAEGIFLWALMGLQRVIHNNFRFSENELTEREKQKYKKENNNVLCFVEECCQVGAGMGCSRQEIYDKYKAYCNDNGFKPVSQIKFNNELELQFTDVVRKLDPLSRRKCWSGIGIMDE